MMVLLLACADQPTTVHEGNINPSVALLVPTDQGGLRDAATLTFSAFVADDRDAPSALGVTWTWGEDGGPIDGQAGLEGEFATLRLPSPGVGEHTVWIEVVDLDGGRAGATATFVLSVPEDADLDGDGHLDASLGGGDCDDSDPEIGPGVAEVCDGLDQDCDGTVDEGLLTEWMPDLDGDGYGNSTWVTEACDRPDSYAVDQGGDCDDTDPDMRPGAAELCDAIDQDCDGTVDEGDGWFADDDGDGWGDALVPLDDCDVAVGGALDDSDCEDQDPDQRWCLSCADLDARGEVVSGLNTLRTPDGDAFDAICDGAWTLIATNTRDATWNPANGTDDSAFGVPSTTEDFKSVAWTTAPFQDIKFQNDVEYAQYDGVGDGQMSWYDLAQATPPGNCGANTAYEWPMTQGNLADAQLCSTNLYLNVSTYSYGACSGRYPAFGASWSARSYTSCPFNLPHASGFLTDELGSSPFGKTEGPLQIWVR